LDRIAPLRLAESWDKVGLHVGSESSRVRRAMVCIDLTEAVMAEAVAAKANLILAYHPPIFRGLERLTDATWKERLLVMAIRRKIAVYSPHTALDAAQGGVNDWLCSGFGKGSVVPMVPADGEPAGSGTGRVVTLKRSVSLKTLALRIKQHLGLKHLTVVPPLGVPITRAKIRTAGVCVGAGGGLFSQQQPKTDVLVTGEMRHHDMLDASCRGQSVLVAGHTETERPYLPHYIKRLRAEMPDLTWRQSRADASPMLVV
ncbi:MAG: Nif3-like dinuclear metal center hexameric protein, partial [Nannocystaceae bacterium]